VAREGFELELTTLSVRLTGGAVHNLYRNNWHQVIMYRDNLAQERPPEQWAIDFGEAFSDVITSNTGPTLRRGLARLMQHPQYRDAVREKERISVPIAIQI
jgi:hypothetical protein